MYEQILKSSYNGTLSAIVVLLSARRHTKARGEIPGTKASICLWVRWIHGPYIQMTLWLF
jgi:hypothetical protein